MPASTIVAALQRTVAKHGQRLALKTISREYTWAQYYLLAQQFGRACLSIGFKAKDAVAIIGFNSPEWVLADVGCILAGGIAAGIYTTNTPDAAAYVVNHANATVVVCEGEKQLAKFMSIRHTLPNVLAYVVYELDVPAASSPFAQPQAAVESYLQPTHDEARSAGVYSWAQFMSRGAAELIDGSHVGVLDAELQRRMAAQAPEDVATLVYTSGTVGMPKAVMITHDSVLFVATSVLERFSARETERMVSYLPLSHIAAAMLDIYGPLIVGFSLAFAGPDALKGSLVETLKVVQPTIFFGVPRVFEKIQEKMVDVGARSGCCVRAIARWAKRVGAAATAAEERGAPPPWGYAAARLLVFDNIKRALGLAQCRILASGAAPLQPATLSYFCSLAMPVHEIYGMSECAGPASACLPGYRKTGTCGRSLPGMEIAVMRIGGTDDDAGGAVTSSSSSSAAVAALGPGLDGEVCMRGRHIMAGYRNDDAASAAAVDAGGWLHSGDIGRLDTDGYLTITGRIKELIKTAGGENVPPVLIENCVKEALPAVSQCVVLGDRRRFLACLLALRCCVDAAGAPTQQLDAVAVAALSAAGSAATTVQQARECAATRRYLDAGVAAANARAISRACCLQRWRLLPVDLSVAGGELTATLKLKRSVVAKMHADLIEDMYAATGGGPGE